MANDSKFYLWDSSTSSWLEITFKNYRHTRKVRQVFPELKIILPNYEVKTDTYLYEFLSAEQDAKLEVQEEDGTWVKRFEGQTKSKGKIDRNGVIQLYCYGNGYELQSQSVDIQQDDGDLTTADNVGVIEAAFAGTAYTVSTDSGATTYSLSNYRYKGELASLFQELQRNYFYNLHVDGSTAYYNPVGYFSSGETLDTSSSTASEYVKIKDWESEILSSVTNKVQVVGTDASGNDVSDTVDQVSSSDYNEHFKRMQVGYLSSTSEATDIANRNIHLDVDSQGRVQTSMYSTNILNETITLIDNRRGINDTFVVLEQSNHYPENISELRLGYAGKTPAEMTYESELELRDERAQLLNNQSVDAGGQGTSAVSSGTGNANVSTSGGVDFDPSDTDVTGAVQNTTLPSVGGTVWAISNTLDMATSEECRAYMDDNRVFNSITSPPSFQTSRGWVYFQNRSGSSQSVTVSIEFPSGTTISDSESVADGNTYYYTSGESDASNQDGWFKFNVSGYSYSDSEKYGYAQNIYAHTHGSHGHDDDFATDDNNHDHGDDITADDSGHDDHPISGTTDSKNLSIYPVSLKNRG